MNNEHNQTITELENEIAFLKEQLQRSKEKENLNQHTLTKIKQIHKEYETSYLTAISEYKAREEQLKNQYFTYQTLLEEQFNQSEQRLNEQISQLKSVVKSKTDLITQLTKQNSELKQIVTKNEIEFNLKENEYENILSLKDKKLVELENSIKDISQNATEDLKLLSGELEKLQVKIHNNNNNSNDEIDEFVYVEGSARGVINNNGGVQNNSNNGEQVNEGNEMNMQMGKGYGMDMQ